MSLPKQSKMTKYDTQHNSIDLGGNDSRLELSKYSRKITSQFGEDGIVEEMLRRIAATCATDGWCVECGASDGIYLSNTYHLISNKGYKGVLIEGDIKKYHSLCYNIPRTDVHKICRLVSFEISSTLDSILATTPIPYDFDFLSIDIDGCDYFIFESLENYRPKIVCVEYNYSIPNAVDFVQIKDIKIKQGASAKSLTTLAGEKGYSLAAVTTANLIFVRSDFAVLVLGPEPQNLGQLRDDRKCQTFLFVGYDGTILSNKSDIVLPWHGVSLATTRLQLLPRMLRTLPSDYRLLQRLVYWLWMALRLPAAFREKLRERLRLRK